MRTVLITMLLLTSINLSACSSMRGNVVPQTGPSMEQIYDSMGINQPKIEEENAMKNKNTKEDTSYSSGEADIHDIRKSTYSARQVNGTKITQSVSHTTFRKIPNPELSLYVFPHLAGAAEIPIPGYSTVFNAYERDHYALPQETLRN